MEENNDIPLSNLRLIASVKEGEYIVTDQEGNIIDKFENTYVNSFLSSLLLENWNATRVCLRRLYTIQLPPLINRLIHEDDCLELKSLVELIEDSLVGICNIKKGIRRK